jgi:hypothetical protein
MADRHPDCVPNAETATAHPEKFVNYLLDPTQDHGKAQLLAAIGYDTGNWEALRDELLAALPNVEARPSKTNDGGGMNYEVRLSVKGPVGTADLQTMWAANPDETHFVTAYQWRPKTQESRR